MREVLRKIPMFSLLLVIVVHGILSMACSDGGAAHVRGGSGTTLDDPAMSNSLDRQDIRTIYLANVDNLLNSRFMRSAGDASPRDAIAILPMINDTSEHVGPQLAALLSEVETTFVNDGRLAVVSAERRDQIMAELNIQQGAAFDPGRAAVFGRQVGAQHVLTGKVYSLTERTSDMRRTQYWIFMQVISVETGIVQWQHKFDVTKALVPVS